MEERTDKSIEQLKVFGEEKKDENNKVEENSFNPELLENSKSSYKEKKTVKWTKQDVLDWIKSLEITKDNQEVIKAFEKNGIDGESLLMLNQNDLNDHLEIKQLGKIPKQ
jgi:transcription initiation factor IIF auxiliary subunit